MRVSEPFLDRQKTNSQFLVLAELHALLSSLLIEMGREQREKEPDRVSVVCNCGSTLGSTVDILFIAKPEGLKVVIHSLISTPAAQSKNSDVILDSAVACGLHKLP